MNLSLSPDHLVLEKSADNHKPNKSSNELIGDQIAAAIYEQGGVVGTICHEPAGLVNIKLFDGSYLVASKKVAAFTNIDIICGLTSIDIFSILSVVEFW